MTKESETDNPRRRPKGDKRARTRAALLAAARELVRERGYEQTSLDAVARRAGMTSGAIYGNFRNRDELLMALSDEYWTPIVPKIPRAATFAQIVAALAEATIASLPQREAAAVGFLTGRAYALGQVDLRRRVAEATARDFAAGAEWLAAMTVATDLPMAPETLVVVIHALTEGLVLQRLLTPELVPDATIHAAFIALANKAQPAP